MKRLTFKPEFVERIKKREKCCTIRKFDPKKGLYVGQLLAAVTDGVNEEGKHVPGFLVPTDKRFATLQIVSFELLRWDELTEEHAARSGVTLDWYQQRYDPKPDDRFIILGFEVLREDDDDEVIE